MASFKINYLFNSFIALSKDEIIGLLDYLEYNGLTPLKYGFSAARPKFEYDSMKKSDVADLCYKEGLTLIKGKDFLIEVGVSDTYARPLLQKFKIIVTKKIDSASLEKLGIDLFRIFKSCYAYVEYNNNADYYTPGRNIIDCLFGFSWLNIFGKPYIDMWGRKNMLQAPAIISEYKDAVLIKLVETPFLGIEEIRKRSWDLQNYFGHEYFYRMDLEHQKTVFKSIEEIVEYQAMIKETVLYKAPDFHKYYKFETNNISVFLVQKGVLSK